MKTLLLVSVFIFCTASKHPFYLSVTDLKYSEKEKAIQGSVKIFTNDFEGALKKKHGKTIDLINIKDTAFTKKTIADYLKEHLKISPDGKQKEYDLLGFEREEEATWVYIEIKNCPQPKLLQIENTILYDHIKEQTNIVHLEVGGEKKSYKVVYPEKEIRFEF
ncbi:MAG: hypothetical protein JNL60_19580 [Bacteroidia bacterium]|nr:hypothetical protein [Bacteroidia bacterium]